MRHPAGLLAVAGRGEPIHARPGLPRRPRRRRHEAPPPPRAERAGGSKGAFGTRVAHDPCPTHLRPPSGRVAGSDGRTAGGAGWVEPRNRSAEADPAEAGAGERREVMARGMNIAFFGSSLVSAYWN